MGGDISIITQYSYEQNIHADHDFCQEVLKELGYQGERTTLLADGAYSGMDNVGLAEGNNIEFIAPALTGP